MKANDIVISGYVSIKSVIESQSRDISRIYIEKKRYDAAMKSKLQVTDQRRYKALIESGAECVFMDEAEFNAVVGSRGSGGIAASVGERECIGLDEVIARKGYIAVLDGIEDPFNFAYSLRSLYAAGVDSVIIPARSFEGADETIIRSSAGASELVSLCRVEDIAQAVSELNRSGFYIASTAKNEKARDLYRVKLKKPLCLIFGGEKRGISREILDLSDCVIKLKYPRDCHYSLPACAAVSIISFECARRITE